MSEGNGKLSNNMLIDWQRTYNHSYATILNGMQPGYYSKDYKDERDALSEDLELKEVAIDIAECGNSLMKKHTRDMPYSWGDVEKFQQKLVRPFISRRYIEEIHDAVEELSEDDGKARNLAQTIKDLNENLNHLSHLYEMGHISLIKKELMAIEVYERAGERLRECDSKFLRDLGNIYLSKMVTDTPIGDLYAIVSSPNLKAKVGAEGFELFPENREIIISRGNRFSTLDPSAMNVVVDRSIQKNRANVIQETALDLMNWVYALAAYAHERGFVKPVMKDTLELRLKKAFHPLLVSHRRSISNMVKYDLILGSNNKVLATTGPNAAGKTTYIKGIGLISLLGQAGSFVPADSATIPVYDRILTHFKAEDSIIEDISLFEAEIGDLNKRLDRLTPKSLFICDELFRGTESGENGGGKLHRAVVESLIEDFPGRTLLSSHYHDSLRGQTSMPGIKFVRFEMGKDGEPTYIPHEGIDEGGYAVKSAIRAGLNGKIKQRLLS